MTTKMGGGTLEALVALLIFLLTGLAWLLRRAAKRIQKERQMVAEMYGFLFGSEEIGLQFDDESVEERLREGDKRFRTVVRNQRRIVETQETIVEKLDEDVNVPDVEDEYEM